MSFSEELASLLPGDLPHRDDLIDKCSRHLDLIVEANRQFNLTRITDPRQAAIKHVLDSVLPWRLFEKQRRILDAGTGAGFPGIPLALILRENSFTLCESVGKKARFVEAAVRDLGLTNVTVRAERAEERLKTERIDAITARAVAPVGRAVELFFPALRFGAAAILYKGPDVDAEIQEAQPLLGRSGLIASIVDRYELPDALGSRRMVRIARAS